MDSKEIRHTRFEISKRPVTTPNTDSDEHYFSMMTKLVLCIGLCVVVVIANTVGIPFFSAENKDKDEDLGKLQFVELPGILDVFAGGDYLTLPIEYSSARLDDEESCLTLTGEGGALCVTCGSGTVYEIGTSNELGGYVIIAHENDTRVCYYGIENISVTEKQVIEKLDTLGTLGDNGLLVISVTVKGKPVNPCNLLPITLDA